MNGINNISFDKFPSDKRVPNEIRERLKKKRDTIRGNVKKQAQDIMVYNSKDAIEDINNMYDTLVKIKKIILEFSECFAKTKKERNIMDFSDIEHFALKILNGNDNIQKKYRDLYEEILIDEYQDSNLVQEYILNMISRGNNIFMVGDVKQSIYKFRQARPELFLEKYNKYKQIEELKENDDLKIKLFKNFRSREKILNMTNIIFDNIMCKELGDIDYTKEEYLNLGASYEKEDKNVELHIIDLKEKEESIYKDEEQDEEVERVEDILVEAKFVAAKIKELVEERLFGF